MNLPAYQHRQPAMFATRLLLGIPMALFLILTVSLLSTGGGMITAIGPLKIDGAWVYGVSGLDAVELQMKEGRRFRIGTDEPDRLLGAIETARHQA